MTGWSPDGASCTTVIHMITRLCSTQFRRFFDRGPFKCYVTQVGVGGGSVKFSGKIVTKV